MSFKNPIISHFFGVPVRFFPMTVEAEIGCRNNTQSSQNDKEIGSHDGTQSICYIPGIGSRKNNQFPKKITIKTHGIPLPDYCRAISYLESKITRMIQNNKEVFQYFQKMEMIPDALGRLRPTILMAVEMCDMLTAKLHTSRIKNPSVKSKVIEMQLWIMFIFGMIRRRQLFPVRWTKRYSSIDKIDAVINHPSGRQRKEYVVQLAEEMGVCTNTIYLQAETRNGGNLPTKKGKPRRPRSDRGKTKYPEEKAQVLAYKKEHPEAGYKRISTELRFDNTGPMRHRVKYWLKDVI